ncbi:MAG: hypothetical protein GWP91_13630 [Rhodobacterales bacterium]|nr:hypothetical protein [Rhodobacterales bacterium]
MVLWLGLATNTWAGPRPDLYRPSVAEPPSIDEAIGVVDALAAQLRVGPVELAWLQEHVQPQGMPERPSEAWYAAMADMFNDSGHHIFSEPQSIAVSTGPDYQRVVLQGQPLISVVVRRDGDALRIDRIEATSCDLCDESTRFVRDLIVDVRQRGGRARRLLPTVELYLSDLEGADPDTASRWPAAWLARANQGGDLVWWLSQANVTGSNGNVVRIAYSDGTEDTWTLRYYQGRWVVDYNALPAQSPLRLSDSQAKAWRDRKQQSRSALERWQPRFSEAAHGLALEVGDRAIDAGFDPLDGTIWLTVLDLDRILSGLFRIDAAERKVLERTVVPAPNPRTNIALGRWYQQWHAQLRPDGQTIAISVPGRVRTLAVKEEHGGSFITSRPVTSLGWGTSATGVPTVLAGMGGRVQVVGPNVWQRYRMTGDPVAVGQIGQQIWAVSHQGQVVRWQRDITEVAFDTQDVCCGAAVDAAANPDGSELLVTCALVCEQAAVRVDLLGGQQTVISTTGSDHKGASWSTNGRWFTTPVPGDGAGILLWRAREAQPVARLPTSPIQRVRWSPDDTQILTVGEDGRVLLWELSAVLDREMEP